MNALSSQITRRFVSGVSRMIGSSVISLETGFARFVDGEWCGRGNDKRFVGPF